MVETLAWVNRGCGWRTFFWSVVRRAGVFEELMAWEVFRKVDVVATNWNWGEILSKIWVRGISFEGKNRCDIPVNLMQDINE
ncbi:hypothetical protein HPP92_013473 [Vanilla planifolia]|uniref:Uncharacterized protein n=1 Tax=Vanilla planifolia TaxID=51239 RepID=A0A835QYN7_VANPL|nr:hypothetical protein HPP92_013473 [Vanilla planifolia]